MRAKVLITALLSALIGMSTQAATNYFTAAVNNQTQNAGNWTGTLQDWDDAIVADWTNFKESATAWANMKYNSVTFNSEVNGGTLAQFTFNTSATTITNFFRDRVAVDADVTKNVRIGGSVSDDDGDLFFENNSPTARFEAYGGIHSAGGLTLTYTGAAGAKFQLGGGAVNSTYAGTTILDGIYADVIVNGIATKGPFGIEANSVQMQNGATVEINEAGRTFKNDVIVETGQTGTIISGSAQHTFGLDVDGQLTIQNGTRWLNGTITGAGTLIHSGGTVVFNNTAMDSDFSGTMNFACISQARTSDQFGTATLVLETGANFRGFNDQAGETISILNDIEVAPADSTDIVRIATTGIANSAPHTVVSNITFTAAGSLSLQALANNTSTSDPATMDVVGVVSDGAVTGNIIADNSWTGIEFPNSVVKLYRANTYTGTTTLEYGRLQLIGDASIDDSSEIIMTGGILDLSTRTGGAYTYGGIFGGSGTVEGDLTLTNSLKLNINGTTAGAYDVLVGTDDLVLGDTVIFEDNGLTTNDVGTAFTVLTGWASISGTPTNLISASGCEWDFDAASGVATLTYAPPPPPTITDVVWTFNSPGDTEGWFDDNEQSVGMTTTNGVLKVDSVTGIDPFLQLDAICSPEGENWFSVEIRARQIETNGIPAEWDSSGCAGVVDHLLGDEGWTLLGQIGDANWNVVDEADGWIVATRDLSAMGTNQLVGIRFDMLGNAANIGKSYEVDYIKLTKGQPAVIRSLDSAFEFNTDGDVEGWTVNSETAVVGHTATNGVMTCSATTGDPQWLYTSGVTKTRGSWDKLAFRARQLDAGTPIAWSGGGTVSVITGVANITPLLDETDRCTLSTEADSWVVVELDISECSVETIGNIRLDFLPSPRTVEVDWIRIYSKDVGLEGYNGWAYSYDDLEDVARNADPDGDGSDNFAEYACGGDPSDPASGPIGPALQAVDGMLQYVYGKRTDDAGLTYSLQGCLALTDGWNDWVEDVDYTEAGFGSAGDNMIAVTNWIPMDVDAKFIRTTISE
ncbi:hypothetical protein [Tichowtungia aerotolerans]|uniref:Uncharacterized protein n=1 Tax=Tichowtungia aerotolerans TaxID=2697043 RepID=A0A6P1MG67_9BACT|nr:hypothetical protein [Tichowtungia aerotolerans]QHI70075.1 hypothetical protein GT409_11675 [Tichowtungia aerotolerans]